MDVLMITKPKLSSTELINKMKEKGISFELISEDTAEKFLKERNNYFRVASYRKNYDKYQMGKNKDKYIGLDFAHLIELSDIDMHFRYLLMQMCLDVEHSLKVELIYDLSVQTGEDGYAIVQDFLNSYPYIVDNIERKSQGAYCRQIIHKYFCFCTVWDITTNKLFTGTLHECPAWVLLEIISFGDFLKFYEFYYDRYPKINTPIGMLNSIKNLRNACAHNNCIINNLRKGNTSPCKEIVSFVKSIPLRGEQLKNKLSIQSVYEILCLIYVYNDIVPANIQLPRFHELSDFVKKRALLNKEFFIKNQILTTTHDFFEKVVDFLI